MRIVEFVAENIKRLKLVRIKPDGSVIQITGPNGSGKTSVLDAIFWALGGKSDITSRPIREGQETAEVKLDLGELIVTRYWKANGTTSLEVTSEDGAVFGSPQKMLDALIGGLSFDPLAFTRMKPDAQLDALRTLVPLDVDLDEMERLNTRDYQERTAVNKRVLQAKEREAIARKEIDPKMDVTDIPLAELMDSVQAAVAQNASIVSMKGTLESEARQAVRYREQVVDKRAMAARLIEEADELETRAKMCEATVAVNQDKIPEPVDVAALRAKLDETTSQNARRADQRRARIAAARASMEFKDAQAESDALTAAMDERDRQKVAAIAAAKMPIEGLAFGNKELLYNGLPLVQASGAEQLRISTAIAMAGNPKLRVIRIKDGSLLDERSMAMLEQMAIEHDMQVWVEVVKTDSPVGIVMEDGEVVAIDGVPVQMEAALT